MITQRLLQTVLTLALLGCLATAGPAFAAFGLDWHVTDQGSVTGLGTTESFHSSFTNTGDEADIFTVTMVKNIPGDWVASLCEGETCYPPMVLQIDVPLGAGETTELLVDITPNMVSDFGSCNITITSQGDPGLRPTHDFTVVSTGLDLLLVTDDTHPALADYYTDALAGTGKTYGVWKQVEMGMLSHLELLEFGAVVWTAGELTGALDDDDRMALSFYVQHGGHLFLSGRDLAYEACVADNDFYTPTSRSWFNLVLGTDHTGSLSASYANAEGVASDLITTGMSFALSGGDGANNTHLTLDGVTSTGGGAASLVYFDTATGDDAAVRSFYGDGRTYFCAFAFEAIDNATDRSNLMGNVLDWFDGLLVPADEEMIQPLLARAPYAAPNPFNPQTSIKFDVGGDSNVPGEIVVYDLKGQIVRRLFKGTVSPGPQNFVWNGRNDRGQTLATGVYLAQVRLDGAHTENVKMTLAK